MPSINFFTPVGNDYYQASWADSRRAALDEDLRKAACCNHTFTTALEEAGMQHIPKERIAISVDLLQGEEEPTIWFWERGTGKKIPIEHATYSKDPFLLGYAYFQCGINEAPPEIESEATAPTPPSSLEGKPSSHGSIAPEFIKNLMQAHQEQMEALHKMIHQQGKRTQAMESRYAKLIDSMHVREQKMHKRYATLLDDSHKSFTGMIDQIGLRHADTEYQMREHYADLLNQSEDRFTELLHSMQAAHTQAREQADERHANQVHGMRHFHQQQLSQMGRRHQQEISRLQEHYDQTRRGYRRELRHTRRELADQLNRSEQRAEWMMEQFNTLARDLQQQYAHLRHRSRHHRR